MTIRLIVGLGNPGNAYEYNRHNAGFLFLDYIALQLGLQFRLRKSFLGKVSKALINNHTVYLLKPETFINDSGRSVEAMVRFFKIKTNELLVVHDELDLPIDCIRFKKDGGHGGHNGLRNIIHYLSAQDFYRLRLGIDRPDAKKAVADFVLANFSTAQRAIFDAHLTKAYQVLGDIISCRVQDVMQALHTN